MSHYVGIETQVTDGHALCRALGRMGFSPHQIERFDVGQPLYGYQGDKRKEKAHVIIRKKYVGPSANDIGFEKKDDGHYVAHISEFDQGIGEYSGGTGKYGKKWQENLFTYYGVEAAKMGYESNHVEYTEDEDEEGRPRLRATI